MQVLLVRRCRGLQARLGRLFGEAFRGTDQFRLADLGVRASESTMWCSWMSTCSIDEHHVEQRPQQFLALHRSCFFPDVGSCPFWMAVGQPREKRPILDEPLYIIIGG